MNRAGVNKAAKALLEANYYCLKLNTGNDYVDRRPESTESL